MNLILISFILYLIFMLAVGIYTSRLNKNLKDFLLGGQKLGPWVISLSERASGESAWLLIGLTGTALLLGYAAIWTALGCVLGIIFYWLFVAKKLRDKTGEYNSLTIPDYFESRFKDNSHIIRIISTFIIVIFYTLYIAAQFLGAGKVLDTTFGIPHIYGMIIGAVIIVLYTILGGFYAVAWTDFFQAIIMLFALVALPIIGLIKVGGFIATTNIIRQVDPSLLNFFQGKAGWEAIALVISGLAWGLGYMGQPHLLTRFMAIDDSKNIGKGRIIAITWSVLAYSGALLLGVVGVAALRETVANLPGTIFGETLVGKEHLLPVCAKAFLSGGIWPLLAGIMISGAIAAMMSTADSQLLVTTSALTEDIFRKILYKKGIENNWRWIKKFFLNKDGTPNSKEIVAKKFLKLSRFFTLLIGVFAFGFALTAGSVFDTVLHAWSGLGAAFGPVLLISLWWKKMTRRAAIFGILSGFGLVVWWNMFPVLKEITKLGNDIIPAFIVSFLGIIIFSLIENSFTSNKVA